MVIFVKATNSAWYPPGCEQLVGPLVSVLGVISHLCSVQIHVLLSVQGKCLLLFY